MYAAKDNGHGFALYSADFDSHSPSRLALAAELVKALANDEFVLHFQPVASPVTGKVESMEALVRWNHPTRGQLLPYDFIPLAEQSGLVRQLTTKVLDLAVAECARWRTAGHDVAIAVNLSANDLRFVDLADEVAAILERHEVPARVLELEVTETALLASPETAAMVVDSLRAIGTRIALDDFGTGYSSLTYLKQLRPDRLKIDRSFVNAMTRDEADGEIVRSVIGLAHSLAIGVTAEGVETDEHWKLLATLACDLVQGFFLSRPMSSAAAMLWLEQRALLPTMASPVPA
jgi:EAL domain-containing protein (putative c-di-GMP-specific phosphodiesterase class I)